MTKYLKQTALLKQVQYLEDGSPVMDTYGNYSYLPEKKIKCRSEPRYQNYQYSTGQRNQVGGTYYVDEAVEVKVQDLLDGHRVLAVYPYYGGDGVLVGYEVHV